MYVYSSDRGDMGLSLTCETTGQDSVPPELVGRGLIRGHAELLQEHRFVSGLLRSGMGCDPIDSP